MWVISLDEGGYFEQKGLTESKRQCNMVGGSIFECASEAHAQAERERLVALYKKHCAKLNAVYPGDMHYDFENRSNSLRNKAVKASIGRVLFTEVLQSPYGQYSVYAIFGDKNGFGEGPQEEVGNLVSDRYATNRYEHMAYRVLQNLLLYDARSTDKDIRMQLATRALVVSTPEERAQAETLGYYNTKDNYFSCTSQNSYRVMLLEALRDSRRKDIQFDLSVESILYRDGKKKAGEPDQAFLYLADILCTIYQEVIANSASCGVAMQSACLYFKPLGAGRCHFWTYHKRDNRYRELYRAYIDGDVFAALLGICQLRTQNEALPYDTLWLKDIENELVARPLDEVSVNRFFAYVNGNTFEPALAMNILKVFQRQREHTVQSNATESMLCRLSQIEMTLYNHTGRVADAEKAYHEAMQRARYCPVATYMELSTRMAVMLCDALQFDKALEIGRHTLRCAESVSEIKRKLYPGSSDSNLLLGRTYSQIGQCLAFMRRYGEASDYFRKAMEAFGVNHGEIAITRTYLLHTLIEAGDEQAYDELCRMVLGCESPEEQLRVLAEMQDPVPQKFALYWYLKGLYFFKRKRLTAEFAKRLTETVQALYQVNKAGQHPWEMNLKYTALLGYSLLPKESQKMATLISNQWFGTIQETEGSILCRIHNEGDRQLKLAAQGGDDVFAGSSLTFMYR